MAILKQRVHRMNSSGSYDTIYYETHAGCVVTSNNDIVENWLNWLHSRISTLENNSGSFSGFRNIQLVYRDSGSGSNVSSLDDISATTFSFNPTFVIFLNTTIEENTHSSGRIIPQGFNGIYAYSGQNKYSASLIGNSLKIWGSIGNTTWDPTDWFYLMAILV